MIKLISPWYIRWRAKKKGTPKLRASITIPWVVVFRDRESANNPVLCNHEAIHAAQLWEGWIVGHWIKNYQFTKKYGYKHNPFEREAYSNQDNMNYMKKRQRNAWKQFIPE